MKIWRNIRRFFCHCPTAPPLAHLLLLLGLLTLQQKWFHRRLHLRSCNRELARDHCTVERVEMTVAAAVRKAERSAGMQILLLFLLVKERTRARSTSLSTTVDCTELCGVAPAQSTGKFGDGEDGIRIEPQQRVLMPPSSPVTRATSLLTLNTTSWL